MRVALLVAASSAIAWLTRAGPTISPSMVRRIGKSVAQNAPPRKAPRATCQSAICPATASPARTAEASARIASAATRNRLRSTRSPSTPAGMPNRNIGARRAKVISATISGDPVACSTYTLIASSSSQRSTPTRAPPSHSRQNAGSRNSGPSGARRGGIGSDPQVAARGPSQAPPGRRGQGRRRGAAQSATSTSRPRIRKLQDLPWESRFRDSLTPPSSAWSMTKLRAPRWSSA